MSPFLGLILLNYRSCPILGGHYTVIRLLKARGTPFVIPAITRKKGGVGKLFSGRASYRTSYTLRNRKLGT